LNKPNIVALFAALLACTTANLFADNVLRTPLLPKIQNSVFDVTKYGAKSNDSSDSAPGIQAAIDAAASAGGGVVHFPAGEFLSGPLRMASGIEIRLEAGTTLKMLPIDRYPGGTQDPKDFITGDQLHDIAITGGGTIDGQGSPWWPLAKEKDDAGKQQKKRPRMITFHSSERILIDKVKLINSPMFHIAIGGKSSDITVRGVTIRAPSSEDPVNPSHNSDACDVTAQHVVIQDCDVSVGDDNFTCAGGTRDVRITHCTYGEGHGVSIGSGTAGGVSDFVVEDCTFTGTGCGIRIKSDRARGGVVERMTYRNLKMTNVGIPILIYGSYFAKEKQFRDLTNLNAEIATKFPSQPMTDRTPVYRDITFTNITATAAKGSRAGLIWGLPEAPATNIVLKNVAITADKPFGIFSARNVKIEGCHIQTPDGLNKIVSGDADITQTN